MLIKPNPGKLVRDPATKIPVPANGLDVPDSNYWRRRAQDGDIEIVKSVEKTDEPTSKPEQEEPAPKPENEKPPKKESK